MSLTIRRILFITLIIIFSIASTYLVLLALGYRIDFSKEEKKIETSLTGTLTVRTFPKGVTVHINDELHEKTSTTNSYTQLTPGNYNIKIEKEGYYVWEKNLEIEPGKITEAKFVHLVKKEPEINELKKEVKKFFNTDDKIIILSSNNNISLYNKTLQKTEEIFNFKTSKSIAEYLEDINYLNSDFNAEYTLIGNTKTKRYALIRSTEKAVLEDLKDIDSEQIQMNEQGNTLAYLKKTDLYKINLNSLLSTKITTGILDYQLVKKDFAIYINQNDGYLYELDLDDGQSNKISDYAFDTDQTYKIYYHYGEERAFIIEEENGNLFIPEQENLRAFTQILEGVSDILIHKAGSRILTNSQNDVKIFFLDEKDVQPNKEAYTLENLTTFENEIKYLGWMKDYENIIVQAGNAIDLVELDERGNRNIFTIVEAEKLQTSRYVYDDATVYYLDNNILKSVEVDEYRGFIF